MTRLLTQIDELRNRLEGWAWALLFPCVLYVASRALLTWGSGVHWVLGTVLSLLLAAVVWGLLIGLNESFFQQHPSRVVLSMFASVVLLAANVCSAWSYILMSQGWGSYTSAKELHPGVFADMYMWQLIDMLPEIDFWNTIGIQTPVRANNPIAGIPILVFRAAVVVPIFAFFSKWYDLTRQKENSAEPMAR